MALDAFSRLEMLVGYEAMEKLHASHVAVFGVGGVGGYAVEALVRSGIGSLDLIDHDDVALTNLNRQIIADHQTMGKAKVDVFKERIQAISPATHVKTYQSFYLPEKKDQFDFEQYDYILDAIDTVTAKLDLIVTAQAYHIPIISALGCGNRLDPSYVRCTDLYETVNDPLAKIMRRECRKRQIDHLKVVYSCEKPMKPDFTGPNGEAFRQEKEESGRRALPGSSIFVPASAGLRMGYEVVHDLINEKETDPD
jgi:tRNA A37 threonylcarbamoyladenosine dehydratase